jgi:hypothetical protein
MDTSAHAHEEHADEDDYPSTSPELTPRATVRLQLGDLAMNYTPHIYSILKK